jgi:membrane protease YdiL (CAAX protease family)
VSDRLLISRRWPASIAVSMIAAVVLVSLAALPTVDPVVSLGNLSGFTLDWLLTFMALAVFRAAVPGAFPSNLRWRLPTLRQWGLVLLRFAASVATWVLIRIVFPDAAFRMRRSYWPTVIPSVAGLSSELMLRLVGAPVLEEVFYRGFLLGELRRTMRPRWAVIAQGVIFGLSHSLRGPYSVASTTVTGVLFGLPRQFGRPPERAAWRGRHSANSHRRRWKRWRSLMPRRDAPSRRGWRCGAAKPFSILTIAEAEGGGSSLPPSAQPRSGLGPRVASPNEGRPVHCISAASCGGPWVGGLLLRRRRSGPYATCADWQWPEPC